LEQARVFIHPSSINFGVGNYHTPWLVFFSLITTTKPFLRDVSECSGYGLMLLGGGLEVEAMEGKVVVGGFARLSAGAKICSLIKGLRDKLDAVLESKIEDDGGDGIENEACMKCVVKLLNGDGLI